MIDWRKFGWWRSWISILALLFCAGCAAKNPITVIPTCPPQPSTIITIPAAQVGKPLTIPLMPTPAIWLVCGNVPPGMEVVAQASGLVVTGTPSKIGIYKFWIAQQGGL